MNINQNIQGLTQNQMSYYNQPQMMQRITPNVDNILFVADLPEEACEEDLASFFKSYNFSFSKVVHNAMRTHAFVTFNTGDDANRARKELNGVKMSAKYATNKVLKPVRLCKYETKVGQSEFDTKTNLLVKNISKDLSAHGFFNMFRVFGDIRSCKLVVDFLGNSKGYGYVSFYRVEDSEKAKVGLNDREIAGKPIKVNFLEHGRRVEKRRNNIYVKHIPKENFNDSDLRKLFEVFGEIKSSVVLLDSEGNSKGFGFVCFENPEEAEKAFKEMQNKSIWNEIPPIYVNFAMKKGERLELLQKKREENFKNSQKMTLFTKIKDENLIKNENDFLLHIKNYLNLIFSKEYEPKSIKLKLETKNAFITMNSQRDAEEFIRKFQEYSKENVTSLFFNLYKSKVERISANAYFKKYNNFNAQLDDSKKYKRYNDMVGEFPMSTMSGMGGMNQPDKVRYNNFDMMAANQQNQMMMNQMINNRSYVSYNNFPIQPVQQIEPQQLPKLDPQDEDSIGEYIFAFVERVFPERASKITGMLMEQDPEVRLKLISSKPEDLIKIIHAANNQLLQHN